MTHLRRLPWLLLLPLLLAAPTRAQEPPPEVKREAEALRKRVASGTLAKERLELAALLGHAPAVAALGDARPTRDSLARCGHEACVRLALAGARAAAARWGGAPPDQVTKSLAAVQAWVGHPCAEHATACKKLEDEFEGFLRTVLEVDPEAADAEARLDEMERRSQVALAVHGALLTVRAPVEHAQDGPAPAPQVALGVVGQAGAAEACLHRAEAPQMSDAAGRLMGEALAGGGHGHPSTETREAGQADLQRWQQEVAAFEGAMREHALAEVRAAFLPWLLR